jgi:hypothetical protein
MKTTYSGKHCVFLPDEGEHAAQRDREPWCGVRKRA